VPSTDPDTPHFSIDGFSPRFSRVIALLAAAAARIIEISQQSGLDPRGDAPIGLDLSADSGISVPTGELARERRSPKAPRKEQMA
jgi:hypothetical protein